MKIEDDPTGDLYKLMDKAGMTGGSLMQGRKPMYSIVSDMRLRLQGLLAEYLEARDAVMFEKGREYERHNKTIQ